MKSLSTLKKTCTVLRWKEVKGLQAEAINLQVYIKYTSLAFSFHLLKEKSSK